MYAVFLADDLGREILVVDILSIFDYFIGVEILSILIFLCEVRGQLFLLKRGQLVFPGLQFLDASQPPVLFDFHGQFVKNPLVTLPPIGVRRLQAIILDLIFDRLSIIHNECSIRVP